MTSLQQREYRGRPGHLRGVQEQAISPPVEDPSKSLHHKKEDMDRRSPADRKRRRESSSSRSRSRSNDRSRPHRRKDRRHHHHHRLEREEDGSRDSRDHSSTRHDRRGRHRRRRRRESRSPSSRQSSRSISSHHRSHSRRDHHLRRRRRSRSVSTSISPRASSCSTRRDDRRRTHRHRNEKRRRKSSRRCRHRSSSHRRRRRHHHHHGYESQEESRRDLPVANEAPARAGIVSDEDVDATRQTSHGSRLDHAVAPALTAATTTTHAKDWDRGASDAPVVAKRTSKASKHSTKKRSTRSSSHDDTIGHYKGREGSIIADRYRVGQEVGMGTFGRVVECVDFRHRYDRRVAVKIVRNIKRYYESAMIEADIIRDVNRRGGRGISHCAIMFDTFTFSGHYCMVFEKLGPSLYDFQKRQNHRPFPLACVRDFATQLLETLEFLHSFRLVHTDLKPENVLLINHREVYYNGHCLPESTRIKVIDFGAATYDYEKKSSVVNTRQYRAPEVILGAGWSMPSDLWSLGCILVELFQGELLFATHDDIEHLALIEQVVGPFPRSILKRGKNTEILSEAFGSGSTHRMERVLSPESTSYVRRVGSLESLVCRPGEGSWFLRLLRRILVTEPDHRAMARECLRRLHD